MDWRFREKNILVRRWAATRQGGADTHLDGTNLPKNSFEQWTPTGVGGLKFYSSSSMLPHAIWFSPTTKLFHMRVLVGTVEFDSIAGDGNSNEQGYCICRFSGIDWYRDFLVNALPQLV